MKHMCQTLSSWPLIKMSCSVTERVGENRPAASSCRLRGSSATSLTTSPNSKETPTSPTASGTLRQKPCCLCWCCCCSCACSTPGKGGEEPETSKNAAIPDLFSCDNEPPPTLEDVTGWARSFDRLMRSQVGRKIFRDFLRCEYSEENILFWVAVEDLKRETNATLMEQKARVIYEDYISILSAKEVSLDSRVREIVNRNMVEPNTHSFDEAQLQIYTLMHRDSYPRFIHSAQFKKVAKKHGFDVDAAGSSGHD